MSKSPTPQAISALLRKAGFERSVSSATRIRGWHSDSPGFRVTSGPASTEVRVQARTGLFMPDDGDRVRASEDVERYAEAIRAAGYEVRKDVSFNPPQLIITASEESR